MRPEPFRSRVWDARFLELAKHVAMWSKDPSTQTGCVIAGPDRTVVSVGYNGFPRGVADLPERLADRPTRLALTVHAEVNAIAFARGGVPAGCTAYVWPWPTCSSCATVCVQAAIERVVSPTPTAEQRERWGESWGHAKTLLGEAGVEVVGL